MQPQGRKPIKFPGKEDCHPPKGHVNWWEYEIETESKKAERQNKKKEIKKELQDYNN